MVNLRPHWICGATIAGRVRAVYIERIAGNSAWCRVFNSRTCYWSDATALPAGDLYELPRGNPQLREALMFKDRARNLPSGIEA